VSTGIFFDFEERERRRKDSAISVVMEPGDTEYLLNSSATATMNAFEEAFPGINCEREIGGVHSPIYGTTLQIILGGLSVGGGIIGTEFLKESGKKLWKVLEDLIKSEKRSKKQVAHSHGDDTVRIILHIDDSTVEASIHRLGPNDQSKLEIFVKTAPAELYQSATEKLGTRQHCPICRDADLPVVEIPCRYCLHNGDKLRLLGGAVCDIKGVPIPGGYGDLQRKKDLFKPRG
jgi:hypothetical protein